MMEIYIFRPPPQNTLNQICNLNTCLGDLYAYYIFSSAYLYTLESSEVL